MIFFIFISERGCLYELSLLLTCMEENEFEDKRCIPEFNKLNDCYDSYMKRMEHSQMKHEQTEPVPNSKNHTHRQITTLLRRYPTV